MLTFRLRSGAKPRWSTRIKEKAAVGGQAPTKPSLRPRLRAQSALREHFPSPRGNTSLSPRLRARLFGLFFIVALVSCSLWRDLSLWRQHAPPTKPSLRPRLRAQSALRERLPSPRGNTSLSPRLRARLFGLFFIVALVSCSLWRDLSLWRQHAPPQSPHRYLCITCSELSTSAP